MELHPVTVDLPIGEPLGSPLMRRIVTGAIARYDERKENEKQRQRLTEVFGSICFAADDFDFAMYGWNLAPFE